MQIIEDKTYQVITKKVCTKLVCDMCGREAEYPDEHLPFEYCGNAGNSGGSIKSEVILEGDYDIETLDLCYACTSHVIELIHKGKLNRDIDY